MPCDFHASKNFHANFKIKVPANAQAWQQMSETERLEWHLKHICVSMGGHMSSYHIFED
jgi:hypothetical protein